MTRPSVVTYGRSTVQRDSTLLIPLPIKVDELDQAGVALCLGGEKDCFEAVVTDLAKSVWYPLKKDPPRGCWLAESRALHPIQVGGGGDGGEE